MSMPKEKHLRHLNKKWIDGFVGSMEKIVKEHRIAVYIVSILLLMTSIIGIYQIKTSGSPIEDMPKDKAFFKDIRFLNKNSTLLCPLKLS